MRLALVDLGTQLVDSPVGSTQVLGGIELDKFHLRGRRKSARSGRIHVLPEMLHGVGRDDRVLDVGTQQRIEQLFILNAVLLVQPQCLEKMVGLGFIVRVKVRHPLDRRRDDGVRVTAAQFDSSPVANPVDRMFEVLQQRLDGLVVNLDRLLQRSPLHGQTDDAAMHVVTVGVTNIVLHVTDDGVVPVGDVQGAVFTDDGVGRTEVSIFAVDQFQAGRSPDVPKFTVHAISLAIEGILLDAQKTDRIADQEVVLQFLREVLR